VSGVPSIADIGRTCRQVRVVPQTEVNAALSEAVNFGISGVAGVVHGGLCAAGQRKGPSRTGRG
jgi:hypothetical protein